MSTAVQSRTARRRWWWSGWGLVALGAAATTAYFVPPYLVGGSRVPDIDRETAGYYTSLVIHAVPAGTALITGPLQFVARIRIRYPRVHRALGYVYLISIVGASAAGAYSAAVTKSGFALQVAFFVLIAAWLYTAAKAFTTIRRGDVQLHRIWMVRNYSLTFAAVTLRLYQVPLIALMNSVDWLEYREVYTVSAWLSLLGNVLVTEYFIVQRTLAPLARRRKEAPVGPSTVGVS
ncbi:DUF2306 domain-containing protein [Cryptosporangium japonicum]|uniref:DUF2306 domain-containing protein n=1 Tax=Cryptosporangium japonicum TaxID=80872 RepID=A0ABN0UDL9_9ACTN